MYSRGERGRRAAGSSVPGCGRASAGAGTDPEWCAMGAESEVGPGGCSPRQSEEQGAPFPGGIKTPQPQHHCAQHRAAEADGGGCVPILPAAFSQAETPAEETQGGRPSLVQTSLPYTLRLRPVSAARPPSNPNGGARAGPPRISASNVPGSVCHARGWRAPRSRWPCLTPPSSSTPTDTDPDSAHHTDTPCRKQKGRSQRSSIRELQ